METESIKPKFVFRVKPKQLSFEEWISDNFDAYSKEKECTWCHGQGYFYRNRQYKDCIHCNGDGIDPETSVRAQYENAIERDLRFVEKYAEVKA